MRLLRECLERETMTKDELQRIEAILIMFNKILYIQQHCDLGNMSPEVAMAEIKSVLIGEK